MRTLFFIFCIHTTACFAGIKESDMPYYEVTGEKKDSNLPKNTARIAIHFEEHSGLCLKNRVDFKINNGIAPHPTLDTNGNYSRAIAPGTYEFEFQSPDCNAIKTKKIEIKNQTVISIHVHFHSNTRIIEADKPVIYLYPEKKQEVNVQFNYNGIVDFTYPLYTKNGWSVNAYPDGTLETANKQYNYLFWDGRMNAGLLNVDSGSGSLVYSSELVSFFENSLSSMGMNSKEIQDFITFWVPKMQENSWNYIRFMVNEEYDKISTIKISPKPDTILRVYMVWSPYADVRSEMPHPWPQEFTPVKRDGFTVVEWGGSQIQIKL